MKILWKLVESFAQARAATSLARQGQWRAARDLYQK